MSRIIRENPVDRSPVQPNPALELDGEDKTSLDFFRRGYEDAFINEGGSVAHSFRDGSHPLTLVFPRLAVVADPDGGIGNAHPIADPAKLGVEWCATPDGFLAIKLPVKLVGADFDLLPKKGR